MDSSVMCLFLFHRPRPWAWDKKGNRSPLRRQLKPIKLRLGEEVDLVLVVPFESHQPLETMGTQLFPRNPKEDGIALRGSDMSLRGDIQEDSLDHLLRVLSFKPLSIRIDAIELKVLFSLLANS